jgi:phosphoribosylanthranilate isomerase
LDLATSVTGPPATPLVKICGLTRPEDVALAVALGAWAVGFVFAPSPRRVTADEARPLVAIARAAAPPGASDRAQLGWNDRRPLTVGVFGDASPQAIVEAVDSAGLDAVQLHASEPGARAVRDALGDRAQQVIIIQAVAMPAAGAAPPDLHAAAVMLQSAVAGAREAADLLLFDTRSGGQFGGTGTPFPWALAREAAAGAPFLVAGGISPHNARAALEASGAAGIDVSSGVERSPGVKDEGSLRALFAELSEGRRT